ncbi:hypothetical protein K438DRAFT_206391 [Mycena galopus ATCC 62051]|nr:hypothetical protein K438DRAFT_206391 [Mycena galopus ATCC 62051]
MDAHAVAASCLILLNVARHYGFVIDRKDFYFPQIQHGDVWILEGGERSPQDRIKWHCPVRRRQIANIEITIKQQDMAHYAHAIGKLMMPTPADSGLIKTTARFIINKRKYWVIAYRVDGPTHRSWTINELAARLTLAMADTEELPLDLVVEERARESYLQ